MYGWTTPSLRVWLLMLGIAGMLGASAIAAVAALDSWRARQERSDATLMATSRAIMESVDRELDQAVAFAHALAIARDLAAGELLSFEERAQKIVRPYGYTLTTRSLGARSQLVETPQSVGETVAKVPVVAASLNLAEDRVTIAPLQRSASGEWLVSVEVPILAGERRYRIDILVPAVTFQRILNDQHLPTAWTPVLLDANWTIVARDP